MRINETTAKAEVRFILIKYKTNGGNGKKNALRGISQPL